MNLEKQKKYIKISIWAFFILNIINTYFLTNQILNRYISPINRTVLGEITAVIGNLSILIFFFIIGISIFKKDKNRLRFNIGITAFLNFAIFAMGLFNLYYGTSFSKNALDIFKNPAEGMAQGMVVEFLSELFLYYRIAVFIPLIVLIVVYIAYKKAYRNTKEDFLLQMTGKKFFLGYFSSVTLFFGALVSFSVQLQKDDFTVGGVISTKGTQNLGVYPYYFLELIGVNFNYVNETSMKINTDDDLYKAYDIFNKNKLEYENIIDGNTYSKNLTVENSILTQESRDLLGLTNTDQLNGIFEGKNVVIVHLESLNHFLLQIPEVNQRFDFLNKIFYESIVFENYYTSVGLGVSADAEASVLTGLYMNGYSTFYRDYDKYQYNIDTLPKLFNQKGYDSLAIHADYEIFYNRDVAYRDLIGFTGLNDDNYYYSLEDFAKADTRSNSPVVTGGYASDYELANSYAKWIKDNGKTFNSYQMISPWPSEFELAQVTYEKNKVSLNSSMILSLYMSPHTPFEYNPYIAEEKYDLVNGYKYNDLKGTTKRYIDYASYIDDTIESFFIDPDTKESRIDEDTVYVFYGDHGSSIKNGDLVNIFEETYGRKIDLLEERRLLQQTVAFIYAPSSIKQENGVNKGLLKGTQSLSRGHVDLYRTIGELFNLFDEDDFYFGVNGLSNEPTFVIDNRIQDLVYDDISKIGNANYTPYFLSLRNTNNIYPNDATVDGESLRQIKRFKMLSDLLVSTKNVYNRLKSIYKK